jgi:hypothetical protein
MKSIVTWGAAFCSSGSKMRHEVCFGDYTGSSELLGVLAMAMQIVMDHTGDTRHYFGAKDAQALAKAEERFKQLTKLGFTAAVRTASGISVIRSFDPNAEETLFYPRLVGG